MKLIIMIFICFFVSLDAISFSKIISKATVHTRKQLSASYGFFIPGNNWKAASSVVNKLNTSMSEIHTEPDTVFGQEIKLRYESYSWNFIDFRLGIDLQTVTDKKLTYSNMLYAVDVVDSIYKTFKHQILAVGSIAYSPSAKITANDEQLTGTSLKYALSFEWVYSWLQFWSVKTVLGYQYHQINQFQTTDRFDPSYMAIRGIVLSCGINYTL